MNGDKVITRHITLRYVNPIILEKTDSRIIFKDARSGKIVDCPLSEIAFESE